MSPARACRAAGKAALSRSSALRATVFKRPESSQSAQYSCNAHVNLGGGQSAYLRLWAPEGSYRTDGSCTFNSSSSAECNGRYHSSTATKESAHS